MSELDPSRFTPHQSEPQQHLSLPPLSLPPPKSDSSLMSIQSPQFSSFGHSPYPSPTMSSQSNPSPMMYGVPSPSNNSAPSPIAYPSSSNANRTGNNSRPISQSQPYTNRQAIAHNARYPATKSYQQESKSRAEGGDSGFVTGGNSMPKIMRNQSGENFAVSSPSSSHSYVNNASPLMGQQQTNGQSSTYSNGPSAIGSNSGHRNSIDGAYKSNVSQSSHAPPQRSQLQKLLQVQSSGGSQIGPEQTTYLTPGSEAYEPTSNWNGNSNYSKTTAYEGDVNGETFDLDSVKKAEMDMSAATRPSTDRTSTAAYTVERKPLPPTLRLSTQRSNAPSTQNSSLSEQQQINIQQHLQRFAQEQAEAEAREAQLQQNAAKSNGGQSVVTTQQRRAQQQAQRRQQPRSVGNASSRPRSGSTTVTPTKQPPPPSVDSGVARTVAEGPRSVLPIPSPSTSTTSSAGTSQIFQQTEPTLRGQLTSAPAQQRTAFARSSAPAPIHAEPLEPAPQPSTFNTQIPPHESFDNSSQMSTIPAPTTQTQLQQVHTAPPVSAYPQQRRMSVPETSMRRQDETMMSEQFGHLQPTPNMSHPATNLPHAPAQHIQQLQQSVPHQQHRQLPPSAHPMTPSGVARPQMPAQGMSMPQPSHGGMIPAQVAGPPQIMPPGPPRMGPATQQALAALTATERIPIGAAKDQYRLLKKKFKFLVFENECYQDELRNLQRKLLKLTRDKNFLLDRLTQFEKLSDSSDDDSDSSQKTVDEQPKVKKRSRPAQRKRPAPAISPGFSSAGKISRDMSPSPLPSTSRYHESPAKELLSDLPSTSAASAPTAPRLPYPSQIAAQQQFNEPSTSRLPSQTTINDPGQLRQLCAKVESHPLPPIGASKSAAPDKAPPSTSTMSYPRNLARTVESKLAIRKAVDMTEVPTTSAQNISLERKSLEDSLSTISQNHPGSSE